MLTHPAVEKPNPKRYILVMGGGQDLEQDLLSMYPDILDTKSVCMRLWLYGCMPDFYGFVCFWCTAIVFATHAYNLCFTIINIIRRVFLCEVLHCSHLY